MNPNNQDDQDNHDFNAISDSMLKNVKNSVTTEQMEVTDNQDELKKTILEQKERQTRELGELLSNMKEKMEQGSRHSKVNTNSQNSSMINNGNNFPDNFNNNRNSGFNNSNNGSHLFGNNIGMNDNNNFLAQSKDNMNLDVNFNNGFINNDNDKSIRSIYNSAYDDENNNDKDDKDDKIYNSAYYDDENNNNKNDNNADKNMNNSLLKSNQSINIDQNSIIIDQNNIKSNQNSININQNSIKSNQNSININQNSIKSNHNSIISNNNNNNIQNINFANNNNVISGSNHNSLIFNKNSLNINKKLSDDIFDNNINNNYMNNINMNNNNMNNNMINMNNNNMNNNMINMNNNNMINNINMNNSNYMNNDLNISNNKVGTLNANNSFSMDQNMVDNFNNANMDNNIMNDNNIINDNNNMNANNFNLNPIIQDFQGGKNLGPMDSKRKIDNSMNNNNKNNISHYSNNSNKPIKPINNNDISNNEIQTPLNINNQIEQEKMDSLRLSQIIERHSVEMSSFYDYTPGETEDNLNQLMEDMNFFGDIKKREIEKQRNENPGKFIPIEDAIKQGKNTNLRQTNSKFKNEYFVLSILAKAIMSQGCTVEIEKDEPKNEEEKKEMNTTMQFLVNGMYNFRKYIFHFEFGEEINEKLLKNTKQQGYFNRLLKKKLMKLLELTESDIIMTNPRKGTYSITAIIKKASFKELSEDNLFQELINDKSFNKIKKVEKGILLSGCILNVYMLDSRGNNTDGGWGFDEYRGGFPYYPPKGWVGYGLRVMDRFDYGDNSWLDYQNNAGEWAVAYHGIGYGLRGIQLMYKINDFGLDNIKTTIKQEYKDCNDILHEGKVGEGIYVTPRPEVFEDFCGIYDYDGKQYKIAFMTRVKPEKIRIPENNEDCWVINGTDNEIRPYRILIKEVTN